MHDETTLQSNANTAMLAIFVAFDIRNFIGMVLSCACGWVLQRWWSNCNDGRGGPAPSIAEGGGGGSATPDPSGSDGRGVTTPPA